MTNTRILLVDDNECHGMLLTKKLQRGRPMVEVVTAATRDNLLDALQSGRFDCVVLDYSIPPFTAPELLRDIKQIQPDTPCVVISSSEEQAVVILSLREGGSDFVPKERALLEDALWNRVSEAIASANAKSEERRATNRRLRILESQANTDAVTGLLNRRAAEAALKSRGGNRDRRAFTAILMIDLDRFKSVNDTFGHDVGDEVLKKAAVAISSVGEPADVLARRAN